MVVKLRSRWYKKSTKIEFFDGIQDLPVTNYNELQKLSLLDLGLGSTMVDYNSHFSNLHAFVVNGKSTEAIVEIQNMYRGYHQTINKISPASYSILPFIDSIDDVRYELGDLDKCKADIQNLSDKGLTYGVLEDLLLDVKKNLYQTLQQHFLSDSMIQEPIQS